MLTTSTELDVMMGERRPEVGKVSDGNIKKKLQNIYNIKMFDQAVTFKYMKCLTRLARMAKWRQRLENIASSTFRSASRCRFVLFCFC